MNYYDFMKQTKQTPLKFPPRDRAIGVNSSESFFDLEAEERLFLTFQSYMDMIHFTGIDKPHRHHIGSTTLSFNLSSKKAFDEGWVVKNTQEPAIDQGNVLEWATSRLKTLIKQ